MADKELGIVVKGKDEASGPFGKIKRSLDSMGGSAGGLKGKLAVLGGGMLAFGKIAAGLAIGGVAALAGALGVAAAKAVEEEASIARLNAALAANIPNWDGNTNAVAGLITKYEGLAFTDDAVRESLGTLLIPTQDLTEASNLMALAADFARAKNIDLNSAAEVIAKVFAGNVGILSRYGVALEEGTTATEALRKIQEISAGQAEAYGNTTKGAFEKFQIAMGNVAEDIGTALLPMLADLATFLNETAIPAIKDIVGRVQQWFKDNATLIGQIRDFLIPIIEGIGTVIRTVIDTAVPIIRDVFIPAFQSIWDIVSKVIDVFSNLFDDVIKPAVDAILPPMRTVLDGIASALQFIADFVGNLLGPLGDLLDLISDAVDGLLNIIGLGPRAEKAYSGPTGSDFAKGGGNSFRVPEERAIGGPVYAGRPYVVGERGPELFMPGASGRIAPGVGNAVSIAPGAIVINGGRDSADQIADRVLLALQRKMRQQGISALAPR